MFKKIIVALAALLAATAFAAVDVNKATPGRARSRSRASARRSRRRSSTSGRRAPFKDWSDLITRVKGVGDRAPPSSPQAGLTVNGAAYTGAPVATPAKSRRPPSAAATAAAQAPAADEGRLGRQVGVTTVAEGTPRQKAAFNENVPRRRRRRDAKADAAKKKAAKAAAAGARRIKRFACRARRRASRARGRFACAAQSGRRAAASASPQPKNARTSSRRAIVSRTPSAISSRVYGASNSR